MGESVWRCRLCSRCEDMEITHRIPHHHAWRCYRLEQSSATDGGDLHLRGGVHGSRTDD
jgi:hypothetical protein